MAKYNVKHACGHEVEVHLCGPYKEREKEIARLETRVCLACYVEAQIKEYTSQGYEVKEVDYGSSKNKNLKCHIIKGSYDENKKSIKIAMKKEEYKIEEKDIEEAVKIHKYGAEAKREVER